MKKNVLSCFLVFFILAAFVSCKQRSGEQHSDPEKYFETVSLNNGNSVQITNYTGSSQTVRIPSLIQKLPVTHIGEGAFRDKNMISVTIPNSVNVIGNSAFENNQLTSVTIPNSVIRIGENVFQKNPLTELILYNVPDRAFAGEQLAGINIIIGDGVTHIGNEAFKNSQLTDITISNNVTHIGNEAFRNSQLTNITIPNSVTHIGAMAFSQNQLAGIDIPANLTHIGREAFADNQLTDLIIPNSVTHIGAMAFSRNQLTDVSVSNRAAHIGNEAFGNYQLSGVTSGQNTAVNTTQSSQNNFQATHRVVTNNRVNLRLRDDQGTNANIIELLPYGSYVQVLSIGSSWVDDDGNLGNWTYVLTSGGSRGWCFGAYLQPR